MFSRYWHMYSKFKSSTTSNNKYRLLFYQHHQEDLPTLPCSRYLSHMNKQGDVAKKYQEREVRNIYIEKYGYDLNAFFSVFLSLY